MMNFALYVYFYIIIFLLLSYIFIYKLVNWTIHRLVVDVCQDPRDRFADFVINAGLMVDSAAKSSRSDADQSPTAVVVDN